MTDDAALIERVEAEHHGAHSIDAERLATIKQRADEEAAAAEAEYPDDPPEPEPLGDENDTEAVTMPEMIVCPFCGTGKVAADEALDHLARVTAIVQPFKSSPKHGTCPDCDGYGTVFTGSNLPEQSITPCERCQGAGYIAKSLLLSPDQTLVGESVALPPEPDGFVDPMTLPPGSGGVPPAAGMEWNAQSGRWGYPPR